MTCHVITFSHLRSRRKDGTSGGAAPPREKLQMIPLEQTLRAVADIYQKKLKDDAKKREEANKRRSPKSNGLPVLRRVASDADRDTSPIAPTWA